MQSDFIKLGLLFNEETFALLEMVDCELVEEYFIDGLPVLAEFAEEEEISRRFFSAGLDLIRIANPNRLPLNENADYKSLCLDGAGGFGLQIRIGG